MRLTGEIHMKHMRGFTLIELMIVVVIVGILAAIGYPSYREQVLKSRRVDGVSALTEAAQRLERCYTQYIAYNNNNCASVAASTFTSVTSGEGYYAVTSILGGADALAAQTFTLYAAPQGDQVNDLKCGTLSLAHDGTKGETGTATDVLDCF